MYLIKLLKLYWTISQSFLLHNRTELLAIPIKNINIPKPIYGLKRSVTIL
jgi:hypothetical protein